MKRSPRPRQSFAGLVIWLLCAVLGASVGQADVATAAIPGVSFAQRIGQQLPLESVFRDETGAAVRLRDCLGKGPAIVVFGYARCPQLCSVVANATVETLRTLEATAGRDFSVVYVSIDPTDSPRDLAALKRRDVGRYGRTGVASGWHYLSGPATAIQAVTDAAGFHFTFDDRTKLYAHASGFIVLTPEGRIAQYFLGLDYRPQELAHALETAGQQGLGYRVYNLLLVCARGLGVAGKYGRLIWMILEVAVVLTVVTVFGGIGWMLWQESHPRVRRRQGVRLTEVEP